MKIKMRVISVSSKITGDGVRGQVEMAVVDEADEFSWMKCFESVTGSIYLTINSGKDLDEFEPGDYYWVEFTPV